MCDASEGLVDQDLKIINMVSEMGKPLVLAFNKMTYLQKDKKMIYMRQKEFNQILLIILK